MMKLCKAAALLLQLSLVLSLGCTPTEPVAVPTEHEEVEPIARTEFTDRLENFFEYEPLGVGKPSQFRIHLTDLADGSPLEQAQVSLTVRPRGGEETIAQTTAKVGKVTGIYVADLSVPRAGEFDIEFHIKNAKVDDRQLLSDFKVE